WGDHPGQSDRRPAERCRRRFGGPHVSRRHTDRTMIVRNFQVRPDSINEQERSVEAVLATDDVVTCFDLGNWEPVDEVLVMDGWQEVDQTVLVDSHPQKRNGEIRSADVHGSVRRMRT